MRATAFRTCVAAVTCWRGGTTPARTLSGASLGPRRTTCGPVAHHPRWWRTSTPPNTASSLYLCGLASALLGPENQPVVEVPQVAQRARPPRLAIERSLADGQLGLARVRRAVEAAPLLVCEELVPRRRERRATGRDGAYVRNDRSHRAFTGSVTIDAVDVATAACQAPDEADRAGAGPRRGRALLGAAGRRRQRRGRFVS